MQIAGTVSFDFPTLGRPQVRVTATGVAEINEGDDFADLQSNRFHEMDDLGVINLMRVGLNCRVQDLAAVFLDFLAD